MGLKDSFGVLRKCSECGKDIYIVDPKQYSYFTSPGSGSPNIARIYQCSYTCYDHALLRIKKQENKRLITKTKYKKYVKDCENKMTLQGKKILHPINVENYE